MVINIRLTKSDNKCLTLLARTRIKIDMDENSEKPLTAKENLELIREYQKTHSQELRDKIILGNMHLVTHFIKNQCQSFINCVCPGYPTFEDLCQIAIFEIVKCIDFFDTTIGASFSSYLARSLRNRYLMIVRRNKNQHDLHYDNEFSKDDNSIGTYFDLIEDTKNSPANFVDAIEVSFLKSEILPYLTFREQYIFDQYYFKHKKQIEIAPLVGCTRSSLARTMIGITNKVKHFYFNGVDQMSKAMRGVELCAKSRFQLQQSLFLIKKHGKNFMRDEFLPSLCRHDALAFRHSILYYAGQSMEQLAEDTDISAKDLKVNADYFDTQLSAMDHRHIVNPNQNKIAKVSALIKAHGGAPFLAKYFLPTLPKNERKAFIYGIMQFTGQIDKETAGYAMQTLPEFKINLEKSLQALKQTDFKKIVLDKISYQKE